MRTVHRGIAAVMFSGLFLMVLAGTAAAHDPFAPPANTIGSTGSTATGSGGPFNPAGSQGSSTATNGTGSSTSSNTSSSNGSGSTGTGSNRSGNATGDTGGAQNLPFTGRDPKPWFVIAYGLIALGASAIVFVKLSIA